VGFQLSPTRDFSQTSCQKHLLAHASRAGCISGMQDAHKGRPYYGRDIRCLQVYCVKRTNNPTWISRTGMPDDQAPSIVGTLLVRAPGTAPAPAREEAMAQAIQRTRPIFRTWSMRATRPDLQRVRFARSTGGPPAAQRFDPRLRTPCARKRCVFAPRERNDTFV
jgi:hypothetical protein